MSPSVLLVGWSVIISKRAGLFTASSWSIFFTKSCMRYDFIEVFGVVKTIEGLPLRLEVGRPQETTA